MLLSKNLEEEGKKNKRKQSHYYQPIKRFSPSMKYSSTKSIIPCV